jgi:TPR repeat protein
MMSNKLKKQSMKLLEKLVEEFGISNLSRNAEQGDMEAQVCLGLLYAKGLGVPRDYAKAAQWYEQAAKQGNVEAQFCLGVLYAKGLGVPQDYAMTRHWWMKAAVRGDVRVQHLLPLEQRVGTLDAFLTTTES